MQSTVVSHRALSLHPGRCYDYEFEDLLVDLAGADLLTPGLQTGRKRRILPKFLKRDEHGGFVPTRLNGHQDLLFVNCMSVWDLASMQAVSDWRADSRYAVCWIKEFFANTEVPADLLRTLERFDLVILNFEGSVDAMRRLLPGTEVIHMPLGIDAMRFNPYPAAPARSIDVHWVGRNDPDSHRALLAMAEREGLHYVFNSAFADKVTDYRDHRALFSANVKRSRLFVVEPAKFNDPAATGGQQEIGYRYFEGASAGARLVGHAPNAATFGELFPWNDAVAELPTDPSEIPQAVRELLRRDDEEGIRRRNVAHCLRHHDWSYRIESLLGTLGLKSAPAAQAIRVRHEQLASLATLTEAPVIKLVRDAS